MGLRDRLLNRLKRTIGASDAAPVVPRPPPPPPTTLAPPPEPAPPPAPTPAPAPAPVSAAPAPEPAPEPVAAAAPAPEPVPEPLPEAVAEPVEAPAGGLVPGAIPPLVRSRDGAEDEGWESDYATTDAPTRNAHYRESFAATGAAHQVRVIAEAEGLDITFPCEPEEFILDAAERAGQELPFSCRSGGCLSCSALLLSGRAEMGEQYVLEEEHTRQGFFLLCCSVAMTDLVVRSHQESVVS